MPVAASGALARWDQSLTGEIGAAATALKKAFGITTVGDLLEHVPRRWVATGQPTRIADLVPGERVTIVADALSASTRRMKQRHGTITELTVTDGESTATAAFFNQKWREGLVGTRALFSGTIGDGGRHRGGRQLLQPLVLQWGDLPRRAGLPPTPALVPVYPATKGATSFAIWRAILLVLDTLTLDEVEDPLPEDVARLKGFPDRLQALVDIHWPSSAAARDLAVERLRFEEALVLQVGLVRRRRSARARAAAVRAPSPVGLLSAFDAQLPFTLTGGQRRVGEEIARDMTSGVPMQRLLQGEVGSGKTVVALRAMLTVVDSGGQAALLAPTEVLAAQHHRSVTAMLGDLGRAGMLGGDARGTRVTLLTGSLPAAARRAALLDIASGAAGIVVGTHALLGERVGFADLGLVVVDEQHRFGVEQRDALRGAAEARDAALPHLLVMTATPIPRTVAMTAFGDLDTSTLDEVPAGRADVATHVVPLAEHPGWMTRVWGRLRDEVGAGGRAFVVCPRIGDGQEEGPGTAVAVYGEEEADEEEPAAPPAGVLETLADLEAEPLTAGLRLAPLHGRLAPDAKDATMQAFAAGDLDVLVATTVIEVGVDVPEATVMVALDADRFGVSQLHQLRGRIGRGERAGVCLLVTSAPEGTPARERVDAVAATRDGMALARLDLEQRREGDVLGAAQSGRRSSLRLLRVLRDEDVIVGAREHAERIVDEDPGLFRHAALHTAVERALTGGRDEFLDRG